MIGRTARIMIYTDKETKTSIQFDDFEVEEDDDGKLFAWTEMCPRCKKKYVSLLKDASWDDGAAIGTCCVVGCWNEADSYVDMDINDVSFLM